MSDEEKVLEIPDVLVTTKRAVMYGTTYSIANITSVRTYEQAPSGFLPAVLTIVGFFMGIVGLAMKAWVAGGIGLVILGLAIFWIVKLKSTYVVRLASASGETTGFSTKHKALAEQVCSAIAETIARR